MNRIAKELMTIASELLPRIKVTIQRTPKMDDRDLNAIHFDIQRFVVTLRKNEELDSFVNRRDDDKEMEITIGFTDHEQMKGIVSGIEEMIKKVGKRNEIKIKIEVPDKK